MSTQEDYNKYILAIMDRYARGEASEKDLYELDQWYEALSTDKKYADGMTEFEKKIAQQRLLDRINKQIEKTLPTEEPVKTKANYFRIAASVLLVSIFFLTMGLLWDKKTAHISPDQQELGYDKSILPGGDKAVLTLADGRRISLTDAPEGNVAKGIGVSIEKTADGQLVYHIDNSSVLSKIPEEYNKIETPRGGQYRVRLPDGTVVWLNAASSLKYPANFAAKEPRKVELFGEAYFEVTKDKTRPFIVRCDGQDVEVLGTSFNVNAYGDDKSIVTTLLEGSVRVTTASSGSETILKPGQQAVNKDNHIKVNNVNADYTVAWKEGYFRFNGKNLDMAMKEIARWYDVKIHYEKPSLKEELLAGTISKYANIKQVLRKMELTGAFHFSITNGEIIIDN